MLWAVIQYDSVLLLNRLWCWPSGVPRLALLSHPDTPIRGGRCVLFLSTSLPRAQGAPGSSRHFLFLSESQCSSREPGPFCGKWCKRPRFGLWHDHCCPVVAASKSTQLTKKEVHVCTLTCVHILLYCALQTLFLTNLRLWQPCVKQVSWLHFSNSISCLIFVSHFDNSSVQFSSVQLCFDSF